MYGGKVYDLLLKELDKIGYNIFSDVLEMNRDILVEGNSLMLTLVKSISDEANRFKRINVQKIVSLKDLFTMSFNRTICGPVGISFILLISGYILFIILLDF